MRKKLFDVSAGAAFLLICAIVCYGTIFQITNNYMQTLFLIFLVILSTVFAIVFSVVVHELGHLIFGLLTGYRFVSFRFMRWTLIKKGGKLRLCRLSVPGIVGQCLMAPPKKKNGNFPYLLYNFGGVILGIVVCTASFVSSLFLDNLVLYMFAWMTGFYGIVLNIFNAIPTSGKTSSNDGTNIRAAIKSQFSRDALWCQLQYNALLSQDIAIGDMPEELFILPPEEELTNVLSVCMGIMCMTRSIDKGEYEEAASTAKFLLERATVLHPLYRASLITELLYSELTLSRREEEIRSLYAQFEQNKALLKNDISAWRTRYAYALLQENDAAKAEEALLKFETCAASYPYATAVRTERALIERAQNLFQSERI